MPNEIFYYWQLILAVIPWSPNPEAISLGPVVFRWYGLAWSFAIMLGFISSKWVFKQLKLPLIHLVGLVQAIFFGGLIGARLGLVLFYELDYYSQFPLEIFKIWNGGLSSHGGALGIIFAIFLYCYKKPGISFFNALDALSVSAALCGALIRLGNLFNSEILGKACEYSWAFVFLNRDNIPRHPVQLYEAIYLFSVYLFLMLLVRNSSKIPWYRLSALFFILTFSGRIILEFFKENAQYTQALSIPLIIWGFFLLFKSINTSNTYLINLDSANLSHLSPPNLVEENCED